MGRCLHIDIHGQVHSIPQPSPDILLPPQTYAAASSVRVTFLSGDVHVPAVGHFRSKPQAPPVQGQAKAQGLLQPQPQPQTQWQGQGQGQGSGGAGGGEGGGLCGGLLGSCFGRGQGHGHGVDGRERLVPKHDPRCVRVWARPRYS